MSEIVNGVLLRGGAVLVARRSYHRSTYPGLWSFPGGHVEEGEPLEDALVRELREEINVTPTTYAYLRAIADPESSAGDPVIYHLYLVSLWTGDEPRMIGDEHTELAWLSLEKAVALSDRALNEYRTLLEQLSEW